MVRLCESEYDVVWFSTETRVTSTFHELQTIPRFTTCSSAAEEEYKAEMSNSEPLERSTRHSRLEICLSHRGDPQSRNIRPSHSSSIVATP